MSSSDARAARAPRPGILPASTAAAWCPDDFHTPGGAFGTLVPEGLSPTHAADHFAHALPDFSAASAAYHSAYGAEEDVDIADVAAQRAAEAEAFERAREQAEAAHAALAAQHERELQEAYQTGIAAGRAEAEAAAQEWLGGAVAALEAAVAEVQAGEQRWLGALEENLAALAAAAARHVIAREVTADDTLIREVVQRAVAEFPVDHPLVLRVSPDDASVVKMALDAQSGPARELRLIADARIVRGGCLVEGRERIVDGRVDSALERIYRVLGHHNA